jgi:hypothetical protein
MMNIDHNQDPVPADEPDDLEFIEAAILLKKPGDLSDRVIVSNRYTQILEIVATPIPSTKPLLLIGTIYTLHSPASSAFLAETRFGRKSGNPRRINTNRQSDRNYYHTFKTAKAKDATLKTAALRSRATSHCIFIEMAEIFTPSDLLLSRANSMEDNRK